MEQMRNVMSRLVSIPEEEWGWLSAITSEKSLKKNDFLIRQGDVCLNIYFIRSGLVRMYYLVDGQEKIRQFFFENAFVTDYASFLMGKPSELFLQALEDTQLYIFPKSGLQELYDRSKSFERLGRLVAEANFIAFANRFSSHFNGSPEEQYTRLINERPKVAQRIPQFMIASYLGITPEALSRIRKRIASSETRN